MYWRRLKVILRRCWQAVLETSWKRFEDVRPRRIYPFWSRCLTSSEDKNERLFQGLFIKTNLFWVLCKLETSVSPIFQTLSQKLIFNLVEYQTWSLFCKSSQLPLKTVKYFRKKTPLKMFDQVQNAALLTGTKICSKTHN